MARLSADEIRERAANDLLYFGRAISPAMFTVPSPEFHGELAPLLIDNDVKFLNVQAPRGHAKTSLTANLNPLHHMVHEPGNVFIVLVSKTEGHSILNMQTIKDIIEYSPNFRALYGYWGRHSAIKWRETWMELRDPRNPNRTIAILAKGADQQLRGLKHINQRPTLVIYDDPEDENNVITPERRDKTQIGLFKGIMPGLDDHRGRVHVIGTPIHAQGLVNTLEGNKMFVNRKWKALNEKEGLSEDVPERDRYWALWPEKRPVDNLLEIRDTFAEMGKISVFYSEYQCEIVGDQDQLFAPNDFRYWDGTLERDGSGNAYLNVTQMSDPDGEMRSYIDAPLRIPVAIFMGLDPASSTSSTADYSVIFVLAMDAQKRVFCLEYWRKREKPFEVADQLVEMARRYKPDLVQVESVGYQEMLRQYLQDRVDLFLPGIQMKNQPRNKKSDRLASMQPDFRLHKVFLRLGKMSELETELILFPRAKNDDIMDAMYYARHRAFIPYHNIDNRNEAQRMRDAARYDWISDG